MKKVFRSLLVLLVGVLGLGLSARATDQGSRQPRQSGPAQSHRDTDRYADRVFSGPRITPFDSLSSACGDQNASDVSTRMVCKMDRGDPFPFFVKQLHVELADGETYLLSGWIRIQGAYTYLQPDFCAHPWLASQKRMDEPGYVIVKDNRQDWRIYRDRKVVLGFVARGQIVTKNGNNPAKYVLMLDVKTVAEY